MATDDRDREKEGGQAGREHGGKVTVSWKLSREFPGMIVAADVRGRKGGGAWAGPLNKWNVADDGIRGRRGGRRR